MDIRSKTHLLFTFFVMIVVIACQVPVLATPQPAVPDTAAINTIIAGTAHAAQTQTALMQPSATETHTLAPQPTGTFTVTVSPTETVIFILPTSTKPFVAQSVGADCDLVASTHYNSVMGPGENFNASWTLKNTGEGLWIEHNVDVGFSGGTDMHKKDAYDLPNSVPPGGDVTITIAMTAPGKSGTYTSEWTMTEKNKTLCKFSATVIIE